MPEDSQDDLMKVGDNGPVPIYGQLIAQGSCHGITIMEGSYEGSDQGLDWGDPWQAGDYVWFTCNRAKRWTCIEGGVATLLPASPPQPWTPPPAKDS